MSEKKIIFENEKVTFNVKWFLGYELKNTQELKNVFSSKVYNVDFVKINKHFGCIESSPKNKAYNLAVNTTSVKYKNIYDDRNEKISVMAVNYHQTPNLYGQNKSNGILGPYAVDELTNEIEDFNPFLININTFVCKAMAVIILNKDEPLCFLENNELRLDTKGRSIKDYLKEGDFDSFRRLLLWEQFKVDNADFFKTIEGKKEMKRFIEQITNFNYIDDK